MAVCKIHIRGGSYAERQQRANSSVGMVFQTDLDLGPVRIIPDPLLPLLTTHWPSPKLKTYLKMPSAVLAGAYLDPKARVPQKVLFPVEMERAEIWLDSRNMGGALVMDLESLRELAAWEDACGIKYA